MFWCMLGTTGCGNAQIFIECSPFRQKTDQDYREFFLMQSPAKMDSSLPIPKFLRMCELKEWVPQAFFLYPPSTYETTSTQRITSFFMVLPSAPGTKRQTDTRPTQDSISVRTQGLSTLHRDINGTPPQILEK